MSSLTAGDEYLWSLRANSGIGRCVHTSPTRSICSMCLEDRASALIDEAGAVDVAAGRAPLNTSLVLAAWRGQETRVSELAEAIVEDSAADARRRAAGLAAYAKALLCNGLGHYRAAVTAVRRSWADGEGGLLAWALTELIEGAARSGDLELAAASLRRLEERTPAGGTDWVLGIQARSRALLSDRPDADALYRESLDRLAAGRIPLHLARAQLLYGEWLRREGRRVRAREQLRVAYRTFTDIGARGFADRAHRELLATGETVRRRSVETRADLTPQEAAIARLASTGGTNPEIGAHLFLSPRTVEWHLKKVFTKLGITSRRQLRTALPDSGRGPVTARAT